MQKFLITKKRDRLKYDISLKMENLVKCNQCKTESTILISVYFNDQLHTLCDSCMINMHPKSNDLLEIDESIEESRDTIKSLEKLVRKTIEPDLSKYNDSFSALAFTPSKTLHLAKTFLLDLLEQKEKLLNEMSEQERLTYQLKAAILAEDYMQAAELRDNLNKLNGESI